MAALTSEQLDELQSFLKDWLRHSGRTQSDLRRALRASSIRMPVLLDELDRTYRRDGLVGLAERLCDIEAVWQSEDQGGGMWPRLHPPSRIPWASWTCSWKKSDWKSETADGSRQSRHSGCTLHR